MAIRNHSAPLVSGTKRSDRSSSTRRRVGILGRAMVLAAGLVLVTGSAALAAYPPSTGSLTLSATTVGPGGSLTASGSGCAPGATVALTIASTSQALGSAVANGSGAFSASVTIPSDISLGAHTIKAVCTAADGGELTLSASITAASGSSSAGGTAGTGTETWPVVLAGVGLVLVGVVLVVTVRRRRSPAAL